MITARFDTTQLPVEQRFAAFSELSVKAYAPHLVESSHRDDFIATIELSAFGPVQVSRVSAPPTRSWRPPALVRSGDPDLVLVALVTGGALVLDRGRQQAKAERGSVIAFDTCKPSSTLCEGAFAQTVLQFPTSMLGVSRSRVESVLLRPMPGTHGIGGLLAYILADLAEHGGEYEPTVAAQLTTTALDLLGTVARLSDGARRPVPDSRRDRIRRIGIYLYMRQRLADPTLTVQDVADAHGISVRHLDRILNADGVSPASWIRRERLDLCRRDLMDPTQRSTPVSVIGGRRGFPDPVVFNRTFQREYGLPPGEYRRRFNVEPSSTVD